LILIAAFIWIGAGTEAVAVATDEGLSRHAAGRAMITEFRTLAPGDPLSRAVDLTLSGTQRDFPVVEGDAIAGVLTQPALLRALRDLGPEARAEAAMSPARTADIATPLSDLFATFASPEARLVCITRD